jgi:uncharacterized protein (TIGR03032 family)
MSSADARWSAHDGQWRDVAQIASQWEDAAATDPRLLRFRTSGRWWELLADARITLVVSREYEHLLLALACVDGAPRTTFMRLPHPSGLAVDHAAGRLYVASTRNPNQVYAFEPAGLMESLRPGVAAAERPLVPVSTRYMPGALYLHDLALVGGRLHANAVGTNTVIRLEPDGGWRPVGWPRSIERDGAPDMSRNFLQLNSIAAGNAIASSFFSASAAAPSARRPGHLNFPVDGRGVIFAGRTRDVVATGLTRPHSARLFRDRLWVDNSGYGEVGTISGGSFEPATRLPGWTRGLCFHQGVAFVGTSRVIPRFARYAPGLELADSTCGVHAVDIATGEVLGSIVWPTGTQIFAVEWMPTAMTSGFPFTRGTNSKESTALFSAFETPTVRGAKP